MVKAELKIVCAGGGTREEESPLHEKFASWVGSGKVLYWPIAMDGSRPTYSECLSWVTAALLPFGVENINMWTDLSSRSVSEMKAFSGVFIGGGNTFRLLRHIKKYGFFEPLSRLINTGLPVYGGSAGALILGSNIMTTHDDNDEPQDVVEPSGLDLVGGYALWCHYYEAENEAVKKFAHNFNIPVLACSERAGVVVEEGKILAAGREGVFRFTKEDTRLIAPGEEIVG